MDRFSKYKGSRESPHHSQTVSLPLGQASWPNMDEEPSTTMIIATSLADILDVIVVKRKWVCNINKPVHKKV